MTTDEERYDIVSGGRWFDEKGFNSAEVFTYGGCPEQRDVPEPSRAEENHPVIPEGPWAGWREAGYTDETTWGVTPEEFEKDADLPGFVGMLKSRDGQLSSVKTSGEKHDFGTGAVRDSQDGKPRYDLIDPGFLLRLAERMRAGAEHYGLHNWTKGIPSTWYMASLLRHVEQYRAGDRSEDHLAAAAFNLMGLMRNEGSDIDDLFEWRADN